MKNLKILIKVSLGCSSYFMVYKTVFPIKIALVHCNFENDGITRDKFLIK